MALRLAVLKSVFNTYNTNAYPLIFFFAALVFMLMKNKKEQRNLLIYEIFGILLLVTPFVGNKILTIGSGTDSNWTMYGILCAIPLTAYVAVQLLDYARNKKEKWLIAVMLILLLQMGLGFSMTGDSFALPGSNQKISQTAVSVAAQLELVEEPYVMAPVELAGDLRECSQEIRVFYNAGYEGLQKDLKLLQSEVTYYGCNYVVLNLKYDNQEQMTENGFGNRVCVDDYVIYRKSS